MATSPIESEAHRLGMPAPTDPDRAVRLQTVTAALAEAVTVADVARVAVEQGLAILGAGRGGFALVEGDTLNIQHARGFPATIDAAWQRFPISAGTPMAEAARTRKPVWVESLLDYATRYPEIAATVLQTGSRSFAALPLLVRGAAIGVVAFSLDEDGPIPSAQKALAEAIASQCALGLERARLLTAERTARAAAEDALARLHLALEAGALGTWEWDPGTGVVTWSPELEAVYGLAPGTYDGSFASFLALVHPDDRDTLAAQIQQVAESGQDLPVEHRVVWPDRSVHWVTGRGRAYRDAAGHLVKMAGASIDITDRKLAEQERERLLAAAEAARAAAEAAVRARDEFLAIAAHELRTPVASVKGVAQLLRRQVQRGTTTPAGLLKHVDAVETSGDRLAVLIEDLLDVSRLQNGQLAVRPEPLDLAELVADEALRAQLTTERHHVEVTLPDGPVRLLADPLRLRQVIANLLGNAVKYTLDGGRIGLSLAPRDDGWVVEVVDQGIGLPPGMAERIFEPFGRAENALRRNVSGMGLGLYICRQIAAAHGGTLTAHSAGEDCGTTLALWLPARPADPASLHTTSPDWLERTCVAGRQPATAR